MSIGTWALIIACVQFASVCVLAVMTWQAEQRLRRLEREMDGT